jgi:solute carrier family 25 (mitochondrial carnitine/acylcarnitine transporter), member 20/29
MQMQPDKYKGFGDALKETVSKHGLSGLYKGVGAPLVGNGFYNAVQFAIFSSAKKWFTNDGASTQPWRVAGAGAFTGVFVALVEGPQDLFKSQMQAQMMTPKAAAATAAAATVEGGAAAAAATAAAATAAAPKYAGVADCAKHIIGQRGLGALTQGLSATIARNVVGVSAYFYYYEVRKERHRRRQGASTAGGCGCSEGVACADSLFARHCTICIPPARSWCAARWRATAPSRIWARWRCCLLAAAAGE